MDLVYSIVLCEIRILEYYYIQVDVTEDRFL